jgi:hypothetical protein|tara:strand:+ start:170 stop:367 length:198 start_codon:yes stop_codon:yes gene_type:complete
MTQTNDKIIDRDALQDAYINEMIDSMDLKDLMALVYDMMSVEFDKYSVDELLTEVEYNYPHLLED